MASLVDQIMELEAKKQALMAQAKTEALKAAEKAIADLNNLGFNYRLVEGGSTRTVTATRSPRKGGVTETVLEHIKKSEGGLSRSQLLAVMDAQDKASQQSISNALANMKKKGVLTADGGVYRAV